jgi:hypothetical protein
MCVHALHTVHALPDLRAAAGRLRDGVSFDPTSNRRQNNQALVGASQRANVGYVGLNILEFFRLSFDLVAGWFFKEARAFLRGVPL